MENSVAKKILEAIDDACDGFYLLGIDHAKTVYRGNAESFQDELIVSALNELRFVHKKIIAKDLLSIISEAT